MSPPDGQLRAFIDRVLRLKAEQDDLAADIRDTYAEAKAAGYDKTAIGAVVSYLRKRDKDAAKLDEQSAMFDLYLAAYQGGPRTHAHARAEAAIVMRHENISISEIPPAGPSVAHTDAGKSDGDRNPVDAGLVTAGETAPLSNPPEPTSSPADADKPGAVPPPTVSGAPSPAPQSPAADDGQPSTPSLDAMRRKNGGANPSPERVFHDAKSGQAVENFTDDDIPAFLKPPAPKLTKPFRKGCLVPDCCASWTRDLCHRCTKAAAEAAA